MITADPTSATLFILSAFIAAMSALQLRRKKCNSRQGLDLSCGKLVFLLGDKDIRDANFAGSRLLDYAPHPTKGTLDRLRAALSQEFDNCDILTAPPTGGGDRIAPSRDGLKTITRQTVRDSVRLTVDWTRGETPPSEDFHVLQAMERELETLRANTRAAPFLLWRQTRSGEVTWVNKAYLDTVVEVHGTERAASWPPPSLFPGLLNSSRPARTDPQRISVELCRGRGMAWYDCHLSYVGGDVLCTAFRADEVVRAENRRREFTQTLTKTFAELATGLAIFDRSRQLVLFNAALMDLTNLPTEFLTGRPSLVRFLDKLRENRVMPEPRDYRSWRASISEIEAAAADGTYRETWSLPDGQTYRVTGRPQPDGAVALLFEDITAEMSLTRRFREELEQSRAVIDAFDDAVAVFAASGQLTMANRAYAELWRTNAAASLAGTDVAAATQLWREHAAPSPIWGDFRDFVRRNHDREEWSATAQLLDGRSLQCRFIPQKVGASLAIFRLMPIEGSAYEELREAV